MRCPAYLVDTKIQQQQQGTITRREAHFRLPSTGVPHSATYAANSSSSTRYPLRPSSRLVTRCFASVAARCSLLSALCSLPRLCRRLSERPAAARPTVLPKRAVATGCKKKSPQRKSIDLLRNQYKYIYIYIARILFIYSKRNIRETEYGKRQTEYGKVSHHQSFWLVQIFVNCDCC